jgi:hypothetical protein
VNLFCRTRNIAFLVCMSHNLISQVWKTSLITKSKRHWSSNCIMLLKVFTRVDAVGGVVWQKWKSMRSEGLECPRAPFILLASRLHIANSNLKRPRRLSTSKWGGWHQPRVSVKTGIIQSPQLGLPIQHTLTLWHRKVSPKYSLKDLLMRWTSSVTPSF